MLKGSYFHWLGIMYESIKSFFISILTWITIFSCSYDHASVLTISFFFLLWDFMSITINYQFPSFSWRTAGIGDLNGLFALASGVLHLWVACFTLCMCTLLTWFPWQWRHVGGARSGWTSPCTAPTPWLLSPPWLYRISSTHRTGSPLMLCLSSWDRWVNIRCPATLYVNKWVVFRDAEDESLKCLP